MLELTPTIIKQISPQLRKVRESRGAAGESVHPAPAFLYR